MLTLIKKLSHCYFFSSSYFFSSIGRRMWNKKQQKSVSKMHEWIWWKCAHFLYLFFFHLILKYKIRCFIACIYLRKSKECFQNKFATGTKFFYCYFWTAIWKSLAMSIVNSIIVSILWFDLQCAKQKRTIISKSNFSCLFVFEYFPIASSNSRMILHRWQIIVY